MLAAHRGVKKFMEKRTEDIDTLSQAGRNENLGSAILAERGRETLTDHGTPPSDTAAHRPTAGDPHSDTRQIMRGDVVTQKGSRRL